MTLRLPVAVTTISASFTASTIFLTSYHSIAACNAQIGSISVTITLICELFKDSAEPFPTSPNPATTATLPANIKSVALLIQSTNDSLHPYLLSNLDFVTESFTLIAGNGKVPAFILSYSLWTPVVVSSEIPLIHATNCGNLSNTIFVRSHPSSRIIFRGNLSGQKNNVCSIHRLNSSSFIPFRAQTGTPVTAIAAAAWSWVEKILQLDRCTSAPKTTSVSISTAVWIVMWRHPAILAPAKGLDSPNSFLSAINPGISASAREISFLPHSANDKSLTLYFHST